MFQMQQSTNGSTIIICIQNLKLHRIMCTRYSNKVDRHEIEMHIFQESTIDHNQ